MMSQIDRARHYAKLVGETRMYEALLDTMADAIVITGLELDRPGPIVTFVNRVFEQMSGYKRADLIGSDPRRLQGPQTDPVELARMKATLSAGEIFSGEVINYAKDGQTYLMAWTIVPVRNSAGAFTCWLAVQNNISRDLKAALATR
ncbi:PAS domain-containing sensor histidine kinase [uncultured Sphingomonas sp.]|uniref:PAS domain-containing protein n=1 Tax=uncultured Sphingomonas sp. TaxID=158754 RepID=UPI0025FE7E7F|nr:PAS domain-containing sensor histidine kinase [uncultured Sphingomonas sp.]